MDEPVKISVSAEELKELAEKHINSIYGAIDTNDPDFWMAKLGLLITFIDMTVFASFATKKGVIDDELFPLGSPGQSKNGIKSILMRKNKGK